MLIDKKDVIVVHHAGKVIALVLDDNEEAHAIANQYSLAHDLGKIPVVSVQDVQLYGRVMFELGWEACESKRTCK